MCCFLFSYSDHFLQVMNCKQNCVLELATTAGRDKPFEDFLPSLFNYLQFSYFNSMSEFDIDYSPFCSYTFTVMQTSKQMTLRCTLSSDCITGENYGKAVECAKTYLLFHPEDEVMKQNLAYYTVVVGEENAAVIHEREVLAFHC